MSVPLWKFEMAKKSSSETNNKKCALWTPRIGPQRPWRGTMGGSDPHASVRTLAAAGGDVTRSWSLWRQCYHSVPRHAPVTPGALYNFGLQYTKFLGHKWILQRKKSIRINWSQEDGSPVGMEGLTVHLLVSFHSFLPRPCERSRRSGGDGKDIIIWVCFHHFYV